MLKKPGQRAIVSNISEYLSLARVFLLGAPTTRVASPYSFVMVTSIKEKSLINVLFMLH